MKLAGQEERQKRNKDAKYVVTLVQSSFYTNKYGLRERVSIVCSLDSQIYRVSPKTLVIL